MKNLSFKSLFIIVFLLLIAIVAILKLTHFKSVSAGWFNDSWTYRKAISIGNTSGSIVANQRVKITLDTATLYTAGKIQINCNDLRVTDINGKVLDHWDTNCNNASTNIYVKLSSIPTSGTSLYIYYGNPSATSIEKTLGTTNNPGTSCKMMKDQGSVTTNGLYYVTPGGNDTDKIQVYCDTNIISEAWTLVINNGANVVPPKPTWANAIDTVNITGTISSNLDSFDLLLGLRHWNYLGNTALIQMGSNPTTITKRAHYSSIALNTSNNYALTLNGQTIDLGGVAPGFYDYHNGFQFTTYDADHDVYGTNCSNSYSNTAWWYGACWSGNIWGGGDVDSYQNKPYWTSSGGDYYDFGAIYIGGTDSIKTVSIGSTLSEELSPAPIAYWKFDEGISTTAYDSSGHNYTGTFLSAPVWKTEEFCVSGKCLAFDNVDDGVSIANQNFTSLTDYTMSAWVNIKGNHKNYTGTIMSSGDWNVAHWAFGINQNNTGIDLRLPDGASWPSVKAYSFQLNKWTYVSITRSGSLITYYVDGKSIGTYTGTTGNLISNASNTAIGRETYAGGYFAFNGFIDEPKIYKYSRTATQIKQDYNAGKAHASTKKGSSVALGNSNKSGEFLSDGLVGYWKMDENTGTSLADSSGIGYTGTLSGATWSTGKFGIGISFNGTSDYINFGNPGLSSLTNATISFWRKAGNANAWLLFQGQDGNYYVMATSGAGAFYHNNIGSATKIYIDGNVATTPLTDTNWHHYVITGANLSTWTTLKLSNYSGYQYNGLIDEIRIYNRALSPSEVSQLYNWAPGPVGYWKMDEKTGTIAYDSSGIGNTASLVSNPIWTQGKFGSALNFNGSTNYINAGNPQSLNPYYAETINAWVKLDVPVSSQSSPYPQIMGKRDVDTQRAYFLSFETASSKLYWEIKDNAGTYYTLYSIKTDWTPGVWYHIAATFDGAIASNNAKVFINGIQDNQTTWGLTYVPQTSATARIGGGYYYLDGSLDDVKLYNYSRTTKQIVEDMNANHPMVSANTPIANWKFDEGYGTSTANWGNGGIGLSGVFGTGNSSPTWTNDGKFGKALSFDGSNDYVEVSNYFNLSPATLEFWFKANNWSNTPLLISKNGGGATNGYIQYTSTLKFYAPGNTVTVNWGNPSLNAWHHLILVITGTQHLAYLDGSLVGSPVSSSLALFTGNYNFKIGSYENGAYAFNGYIDEVKIYNYALTPDEVKIDYNRGSALQMGSLSSGAGNTAPATAGSQEYCIPGDTSACSPPIAEWKMDEKTGGTIFNTSGTGNTGVFGTGNSAPTWTNGKIGTGLNFDGTKTYVIGADTNFPSGTSARTIETWFKTTANIGTNVWKQIFNYGTSGSSNQWFGVAISSSTDADCGTSNSFSVSQWGDAVCGNTSVNDGRWHHGAVTYDGSTYKIYVDGIFQKSGSMTTNSKQWHIIFWTL